ncbi:MULTISPECIES: hypothetical protein [Streptococcus]|uniref:Uncharacterized protein n=1 Tax=Streptococcus parauberis KRS-02083 TaxID=1207545 RepID=A0ABN0IRG2_9STRE|nr:hypothetical protein [Streptococcus parauberis]AUT06571.1 hypothetical protein SPSF3K_01850 [Streptococcus parauberis]EMG25418.1 hypothetical protein SPJ1_0829 [Streptococcus parauberis KRS-02083]KYP21139.1 hypothetical protein AKL13_00761 [Streptococcus parauberis]KYP21523.1 hypothetical protein TN39_00684 [Streptococcus parauberis]KYP22081.1 hypothetical protein AKL14_00078 [Streptococcus parauberis]
MGKLEELEQALSSKHLELEKLEDNYHRQAHDISEQFFELDSKRTELENFFQESYEATSYTLRKDDIVDEDSFRSLNQIIESFQTELDDGYNQVHQNLIELEDQLVVIIRKNVIN